MKRTNLSSGARWEDLVGYSRAVAYGNHIEITGTVSTSAGEVLHKDDPYNQALFILRKIEKCMQELGGQLSDVIRTRMYVVNIKDWPKIGKAHAEFFGEICPTTTMVEVCSLIDKDFLVEIEASAYKGISEIETVKFLYE